MMASTTGANAAETVVAVGPAAPPVVAAEKSLTHQIKQTVVTVGPAAAPSISSTDTVLAAPPAAAALSTSADKKTSVDDTWDVQVAIFIDSSEGENLLVSFHFRADACFCRLLSVNNII